MNKKSQLTEHLEKYCESYSEIENNIIITTTKPLIFQVDFSNNKTDISAKLKGWNFLTGFLEMRFEKVASYISIMLILMILITLFSLVMVENEIENTTVLISITCIVVAAVWTCLFYINYRIKYENMKNRIVDWTN